MPAPTNTRIRQAVALACMLALGIALLPGFARAQDVYTKQEPPTIEKTVSVNGDIFTKMAWAGVGDTPRYRLAVTLPAALREYATYPLIVQDEFPPGMELDTSAPITVRRPATGEALAEPTAYYDGVTRRLTVSIPDVRTIAPDIAGAETLVISYTAKVLGNASTGEGNPNTNAAWLEYPADPAQSEIAQSVKSIADIYIPAQSGLQKPHGSGSPFDQTGDVLGRLPWIAALALLIASVCGLAIHGRPRGLRAS